MNRRVSAEDRNLRRAFEACETTPEEFDHAAHVRLAYIYLCESPVDAAAASMKTSLLKFLAHLGIGEAKYHEIITRAWVMAVHYFMTKGPESDSAAAFIGAHLELLDSKIMLTHYSAEVLFSPGARRAFIQPNIQSIPPR